jgi:hypothetical protein
MFVVATATFQLLYALIVLGMTEKRSFTSMSLRTGLRGTSIMEYLGDAPKRGRHASIKVSAP